ncbi:MAG: alanine:cation symporter family protein [Bacteroidetes bacterium]|nr:alanine:cation symporter family protein [Bacteroidota bacterium]MCB9226808.1 alanine:cation symporter family protein [Chitinophagales bacterium]
MKKLITLIFTLSIFTLNFAQEHVGLDSKIDELFGIATGWFVKFIFWQIPISEGVGLNWVLIPLIVGALFFTLYFGFPNIRFLPLAIKTIRGDFEHVETDPNQPNISERDNPDTIRIEGTHGEVTHFQALTAALSATVGLGNIAGVAVAVVVGGAGATFWMIIAGLLGMSSKFVECTLGVKYRERNHHTGTIYGGPMYYLSKGMSDKGFKSFGKVLAVAFAILCIGGSFGGGNMFQANQAFEIFRNVTGGHESFIAGKGWIFGIAMALLVGAVIIGGIRRIAQVTEKIVPFMAVIYVGAALVIIFMNIKLVPEAVSAIVTKAFSPTAITGGFLGVLIQGFRRAAFSNEAGVGSAAIAHSAVKTKFPASEGLVALLEPFIDTVVICTITALVIVIGNLEGFYQFGGSDGGTLIAGTEKVLSGVELTNYVFETNIPNFQYILTGAVVLFAFSTMISWSYYGLQSWTYLFGKTKNTELTYKILFCVFVVIGAAAKMGNVLDFSDAMIFGMMVPNMIGLLFLYPKVKEELELYIKKIKEKRV